MPVIFLTTNPPSSSSYADGANPPQLAGKAGEAVVTELHGKWYTSAYRGKVFLGQTAAAGTIIPITTTTTFTFLLWNPLGSGVNVELISADVGITGTTFVAGAISLGLLSGATIPTTVTTTYTPISSLVGGSGVSQVKLYGSAVSTAMANFVPLFGVSTTAGFSPLLHYEFDGKIVLPPGSQAALVSTAAQTVATANNFIWAEYPI